LRHLHFPPAGSSLQRPENVTTNTGWSGRVHLRLLLITLDNIYYGFYWSHFGEYLISI
jgi:hypothetical protein